MTEREKVARLIELLVGVQSEMGKRPKCDVCIAVKLVRVRTLLEDVFSDYERFLD
jgi:hypothetical protein